MRGKKTETRVHTRTPSAAKRRRALLQLFVVNNANGTKCISTFTRDPRGQNDAKNIATSTKTRAGEAYAGFRDYILSQRAR